jgi:hypothetical protein
LLCLGFVGACETHFEGRLGILNPRAREHAGHSHPTGRSLPRADERATSVGFANDDGGTTAAVEALPACRVAIVTTLGLPTGELPVPSVVTRSFSRFQW